MSVQYAAKDWLEEYDYEPPRPGQMRRGVIIQQQDNGLIVDIGLKRDGFVPQNDIERLDEDTKAELYPGQEIVARIMQPREQDDIHILSLYQARLEKDWAKAEEIMESGQIWHSEVVDYNRGGLLVSFKNLQGFVPTSHVTSRGGRQSNKPDLQQFVGQELPLHIIEVNRAKRRLIMSERLARRQLREENMERLLNELVEGEVRRGVVVHLCDFGAFVDLGGVDGLIHVSELAWHTVRHPGEIVQVGDEVDVYILKLDRQRKRISLSLKRLQPNPWVSAYKNYAADQLVSGKVTNVVDFGAFVALGVGLEGLVHVSELADPPPHNPRDFVQRGDQLVLRILSIDVFRQRLALSLKRVSEEEQREWLAQQQTASVEPNS